MSGALELKQVRLYTNPDRPVTLALNDGKIERITTAESHQPESPGGLSLDMQGRLAVPGMIDLHIHGAGGADVFDGTPESLRTMSTTLGRLGTTAFLATTMINQARNNQHLAKTARMCGNSLGGAHLLGIHLEGPFINPIRRGGIQLSQILAPAVKIAREIIAMTGGSLRMMTLAPELSGMESVIDYLHTQPGLVLALGHSNAGYEEAQVAFQNRIHHVTHIFNALPPLNHRNPGAIAAALENPQVSLQAISDGVHLHPAMLRFLYRHAGSNRIACITDGMQGIGLPDGRYFYGELEYESLNGTARFPDGTLIGSTLSLWDVVRRYHQFTGCSLAEAVTSGSEIPARILGLESSKGRLLPGYDADLLILEPDLSLYMVVISGQIVYRKT